MWPFESSNEETLRIGRFAVERWRGTPGRLECVARHALHPTPMGSPGAGRWSGLEAAVAALYAHRPASPVTLLLESACMPVIMLEAGAALWKTEQMLALARHRLHALHAAPGTSSADWDIRIDHRAGDPVGLAFCLAPSLRKALLAAASTAGVRCRRMLPAMAWGLRAWRPVARHHGWLAWQEQDRTLLALVHAGKVSSLNAAAPIAADSASMRRQVMHECVRRGAQEFDASVLVTHWHASADSPAALGADPRVTWLAIGRGTAPVAATGDVTGQGMVTSS